MFFLQILISLCLLRSVLAVSRTDPPDGALVVPDVYDTIQDAVDALPDDGSEQIIFINPGTYNEQVYIDRDGPLIVSFCLSVRTCSSFPLNRYMATRRIHPRTCPTK